MDSLTVHVCEEVLLINKELSKRLLKIDELLLENKS